MTVIMYFIECVCICSIV